METLYDLLRTFRERAGNPAIVYRSGVRRFVLSYGTVHDLALRMASCLAARGVGPGDRVLIWGPNSPGWVVAFWGIVARGGVAVPVDFLSGRERAETIARLAGASFAIQSRAKPERLEWLPGLIMEELEHLLTGYPTRDEAPRRSPGDPAELIYTSGTTGSPKGVNLSHANLLANLEQVNRHFPGITSSFRFLSLLPLSHMFEQMGGFLTPFYQGATIVQLGTLKPSAIMAALAEEEITAMIAVPRLLQLLASSIERELAAKGLAGIFARLLKVAGRLDPGTRKLVFAPIHRKFGRHFAFFVSGGAPLPAELFRFWNAAGFTVIEGYGLTECSPVLTGNTMEHQLAGAVGWPLPGVELRLAEGEIQVRGANVFSGYYGNDAATREAFTADGWFRTGDLGELATDGALVVKGRVKELIITAAGINVYPDEIDEIIARTPGVREGCVIGLDRGQGEEVHGVIVPDGSGRPLEEIVEEVNGQLDELHRITGVSRWPEMELPKTTTMKVRKFLVKERLMAGRQEESPAGAADRLSTIIAQVLGAPQAAVREEAFLVADLGLTSIGRLELVNVLEQEFRLDLDETLVGPQTRVADLRQMIARREKTARPRGLRFWTNSAPVRGLRRFMDLCFHYPLLRLFVRLRVVGRERLAGLSLPAIFVANHVSYLDQPVIMFSLPPAIRYRCATAAWAEFFFVNYRTPLGRIWKRFAFEYCTLAANVFPLPQSSGFRGTLQHMGRLVDHGIGILVFPEGERSRDGRPLPFRQGLGIMVRELVVPVVPVTIGGLEKVLPRGARVPRRGEVTVTFGPPLTFTTESPAEIVSRVEEVIARQAAGGDGGVS